jgi:lipopolysaccharide biosynthesis glycosyltransferase
LTQTAEQALVFAGEDVYARGIAVAMRSALAQLSPSCHADVYILDTGLSHSSRVRLERVFCSSRQSGELQFVPVVAEIERLPSSERFPVSVYAKLLLPELLPPAVTRALYLDADLLVKGDLSPLFTIDLGGAVVGAVRDAYVQSTRPYLNAGVLVVDVTAWRADALTSRVLGYAAAAGDQLRWADQDALNVVIDDWHELGAEWNLQLRNASSPPDRPAVVLHFVGPKPWDHRCLTPGTAAWVRTLLRTGWYSRTEALAWMLRWQASRMKYRVALRRS